MTSEYKNRLNKEILLEMGFTEIPHFTIMGALLYDLGRNRQLSVGSIGTPNEMVFLCEIENDRVTNLICVHNYDYDAYITKEKLSQLITIIKSPRD